MSEMIPHRNWSVKLQNPGPESRRRRPAPARGLTMLAGLALLLTYTSAAGQGQVPPRQARPLAALPLPSDEQSYQKELVFGVNFNTQGALIGGATLRSARVLDERWLRFWSLEGVMFNNDKEQRQITPYGGSVTYYKTNYAFSLRPSFGAQRILFRKAAVSGVQVNALLSAGPSLGLLMPYYISYDRTPSATGTDPQFYQQERYDPAVHTEERRIVERASLFAGLSQTKLVPGAHLRAALSFEYGRYRDAVAGLETGFLVETFTKPIVILKPDALGTDYGLDKKFFPSVYITLYFGHRS